MRSPGVISCRDINIPPTYSIPSRGRGGSGWPALSLHVYYLSTVCVATRKDMRSPGVISFRDINIPPTHSVPSRGRGGRWRPALSLHVYYLSTVCVATRKDMRSPGVISCRDINIPPTHRVPSRGGGGGGGWGDDCPKPTGILPFHCLCCYQEGHEIPRGYFMSRHKHTTNTQGP